jgi:hypothetical protein
MPTIPGTFEKQLVDVQNVASGIVTSLVSLKYAGPADKGRMRDALWEKLQDYAALVQELAAEQ